MFPSINALSENNRLSRSAETQGEKHLSKTATRFVRSTVYSRSPFFEFTSAIMTQIATLKRLLAVAETIRSLTAHYQSPSRPINIIGILPPLAIPLDKILLPPQSFPHLVPAVRASILNCLRSRFEDFRSSALESFSVNLSRTASMEDIGGCSDTDMERSFAQAFQSAYNRELARIIETVQDIVSRLTACPTRTGITKGIGFGPVSSSYSLLFPHYETD